MSLAILLGAGRGFGLEAARCLGMRGHDVVITDINPGHLHAGQASLEASGVRCRGFLVNACSLPEMQALAENVGAADDSVAAVVCVVGGSLGTPRWVDDIRPDHVKAVIDLCVGSALNAMGVFREGLLRARGAILFVSSGAARIGDRLGWSPVYAFGKGAMLGMARYIACDPQWAGVRAIAICPGDVATERTAEIHSSAILTPEEVEIVRVARNSLGRMATPGEVGEVIAQLVMNAFASGSILDLNGGEYPTPA